MTEKILFDPGFAPLVYDFVENIKVIKNSLNNIKIPNQRKFRFKILQPQILELIKNSVAFYLGCLLWARYLKNTHPEKIIENNPFLDIDVEKEGITNEIFCSEINYFLDFCEKYPKDCKFYSGKEFFVEEKFYEIAKTYKEFLLLNNSFVHTKYASDIVLPVGIDRILKYDDVKNKELIDQSISDKNILIILNAIDVD